MKRGEILLVSLCLLDVEKPRVEVGPTRRLRKLSPLDPSDWLRSDFVDGRTVGFCVLDVAGFLVFLEETWQGFTGPFC